jgi:hypothetical protein
MVYFQTKNPYLGKFLRTFELKILVYLKGILNIYVIWYMLWPFGNLVVLWYIYLRFGILCQEKSGNLDSNVCGVHLFCRHSHLEARLINQD